MPQMRRSDPTLTDVRAPLEAFRTARRQAAPIGALERLQCSVKPSGFGRRRSTRTKRKVVLSVGEHDCASQAPGIIRRAATGYSQLVRTHDGQELPTFQSMPPGELPDASIMTADFLKTKR